MRNIHDKMDPVTTGVIHSKIDMFTTGRIHAKCVHSFSAENGRKAEPAVSVFRFE